MIRHSRPTIRKKDLESALTVMISDNLATGDIIYKFERTFANYFGKSFSAIFVNNGTNALELIFRHLNIGEGNEVIISSFLNSSPLQVIKNLKATPIVIDINEDSFQISMDNVIEAINEKTKAIIVSHMFGNCALIDELTDIKIPIIEDATHSLGGKYRGLPLGSFGDYAYFSLSATRMITSGGSGGMIITKKKGVDYIRDIIHYDKKEKFISRYNYQATDLQASIGIEEFKNIERMVEIRNDIALCYDNAVLGSKLTKFSQHDSEKPSYYRYVCMLEENASMNIYDIINMFKKYNVEVNRPIFRPIHQYLNLPNENYPHTENAYLKSISIPIYPTLQKSEVDLICKLIKQIR